MRTVRLYGRSALVLDILLNPSGNLNWLVDSPAQVGGLSAALTQIIPERVFSLVGLMICAADGPPLGRGRSAIHFENESERLFASGGVEK